MKNDKDVWIDRNKKKEKEGIQNLELMMEEIKDNGFLQDVSNKELAFCASPIHDFDRCPFIERRDNCKSCKYYH